MQIQNDFTAAVDHGASADRAVQAAFEDAVRRHRRENEPMVFSDDGEVRLVSPFDVPLPEDDAPAAPRRAPDSH